MWIEESIIAFPNGSTNKMLRVKSIDELIFKIFNAFCAVEIHIIFNWLEFTKISQGSTIEIFGLWWIVKIVRHSTHNLDSIINVNSRKYCGNSKWTKQMKL